MADTIEEIVKASYTDSSFNSSGEATILTAQSGERFVIKEVRVEQGDANISVVTDLKINDMTVATNLTGVLTGYDIVGGGNAVKLKSSTFPLDKKDHTMTMIRTDGTMTKIAFPLVNGFVDGQNPIVTNSISLFTSTINENAFRYYIPIEGSGATYTNQMVQLQQDWHSTHRFRIINSSNNLMYEDQPSYTPFAFDGERYVYKLNGHRIDRYDVWERSNTSTYFDLAALSGLGSGNWGSGGYPYLNISYIQGKAWMLGYEAYNGSAHAFMFRIDDAANTYMRVGGASANNAANNTPTNSTPSLGASSDKRFWFMRNATTSTYIRFNNSSNWEVVDVDVTTGAITDVENGLSASGNFAKMNTNQECISIDGSMYYIGQYAHIIKFTPSATSTTGDATFTNFSIEKSLGQPNQYNSIGNLGLQLETPSSSTLSSRTYTINPSLTLRITGVKSTV